jgi:exopolysaccharide/PEP-CTERM locus tyrosine autokinase
MSKIEKALGRARSEKGLVVVGSRTRADGSNQADSQSRDLTVPEGKAAGTQSRADAAAAIAQMNEPSLRDRSELTLQRIIYPDMAENSTVQAFREIRTRILQKTHGQNCVIMVTSVAGDSGSTFVATNLGVAFAFDAGKTALLVDCNLRNPGLQKLFPNQSPLGITDYLEKADLDVADIIHPIGIERLRVIPAGDRREIPSEYFTSLRMKQLLSNIRQRYAERFILVDAPPMSETADTQILAELCDYVLLVVPYGKVTNSQVDACIKSLDSKKVLGVVFNNEPSAPSLDWKEMWKASLVLLRDSFLELIRTIRNAAKKK